MFVKFSFHYQGCSLSSSNLLIIACLFSYIFKIIIDITNFIVMAISFNNTSTPTIIINDILNSESTSSTSTQFFSSIQTSFCARALS